MKTKKNDRAYPDSSHEPGFTKREYYAGQAMQGLLSNAGIKMTLGPNEGNQNDQLAKIAVSLADALIKELNGENNAS